MMTIDLASLFADAECPDCILADALEESGIVWERANMRSECARLARRLYASMQGADFEHARQSVALAEAILWAQREGVDFDWDDDREGVDFDRDDDREGERDEDGELPAVCWAYHPAEPEEIVTRYGITWRDDDQLVKAQLALELRPLIPEPHPLTDCCPYGLAKEYGLFYSGDVSPIPHGGYWYSLAEWEKWGYAPIVEVREWRGDDEFLVSVGSVNRQEGESLDRALASVGCTKEEESDPQWQIDAIKGYWGADYDQEETFVVSSRKGMNALWAFIAEALDTIRTNKKGD